MRGLSKTVAVFTMASMPFVPGALILDASSISAAGAPVVGPPLGASRRAAFDSIEMIRCCGWGPRGWYDTWRNCHYCGFGHPDDYCRFSVRRWRWFCPR